MIGAHFDLVDCLGGELTACESAATRLDHAAWASLLRGAPTPGMDETERLTWSYLACADGVGTACAAVADERLSRPVPDRLRAATLHLRACALGVSDSCALLGLSPPASLDESWLRLSDGEAWSSTPVAAAVPELRIKAWACDNRREPLAACLDFAAAYWRTLGAPEVRQQSERALQTLCPTGREGAACALKADLYANRVLDPRLDPSMTLLDRLCADDGVARACSIAAGLLEIGRASPYGTPASRRRLQRACDATDTAACNRLTAAYTTPLAVATEARCQRALGGGHDDPRACTETATMLQFGVGLPKDPERADELRRAACAAGDADPCAWFGLEAWNDLRFLDATAWYDRACAAGHGASCGVVGRMAMSGEHGTVENLAVGIPRLRQGCELGGRNACYEFGYNYSQGRGLPTDPHIAYRRYLQACGMGHLRACTSLAVLILEGRGTVQNPAQAVAVLGYACTRGDGAACRSLGQLYATGTGVPADPEHARWASTLGCELGHPGACTDLAALPAGPATPLAYGELPALVPLPVTTEILSGANVAQPGSYGAPADPDRYTLTRLAQRMVVSVSAGGQRSWTADNQATALRLHYAYLFPWLGVGGTLDWVSDDRWRPRLARTYWRFDVWVDGFVHVDLGRYLELWTGLGLGIGGYRPEPGRRRDVVLSGGAHEFLQLDVRIGRVRVGARLEQQQLGQNSTVLDLDHVTGVYGVVGFGGG